MCKYCDNENNEFKLLNNTWEYSDIEITMSPLGYIRARSGFHPTRLSSTEEIPTIIFDNQDIIPIKFCIECGKKFDPKDD